MNAAMADGKEVSLRDILAARDRRAARQKELLAQYRDRGALACLGVNMPGPVKRCGLSETIFDCGRRALADSLPGLVLYGEVRLRDTGCEGYFIVSLDAAGLKARMCALEDNHPLGRLWDIDVLSGQGVPISRQSLGRPPRRCLLCQNEAAACARSRAHPLPALLQRMERMVRQWEAGQ